VTAAGGRSAGADRDTEAARLRAGLEAQSSLARVLAEAPTFEEAGPKLLEAIGRGLGWDLGYLWTVDERAGALRCRAGWSGGVEAADFQSLSARRTFSPGKGLPGQVWDRGAAISVPDVLAYEHFERTEAASAAGLRGAFGFPVRDRGRILGVIEFFSTRLREPDPPALELAETFGHQIGQYLSRRRAEAAVRESEARKAAILESALEAIITIDSRGRVVDFNAGAEGIFAYTREEAVGRELAELIVPPALRDAHREALDRAVETGEGRLLGRRLELTGMRADGTELPVELTIARLGYAEPPAFVGYVRDITDRKRAEARAELLADAGEDLTAALEVDAVVGALASLCVPQLADWCVIDVLAAGGRLERVAVAHADPAHGELAAELERRSGSDSATPGGVAKAMRSGRAELVPEVVDDLLEVAAEDETHLAVLRELGVRSAMIVPLRARGRTLGAVSLLGAKSGRRFDEDDLGFVEEIARRAALALDNARIHGERSQIAATLQASLLPPRLPRLPGVAVASRFRAAGEVHEVGGDFFDLFATAPGDWTVVMGDVAGKGPEAAAVTALARYTVREAAAHDAVPSAVLRRLNEAILAYQAEGGDRFCTAVVGRVRPTAAGARLTLASGGHPLPLRLDVAGRVEAVGSPGMLLGVGRDPELHDADLELEQGDSLLLYTDGVTETPTAWGLLGERGLRALLESSRGLDADALVERVDRIVVGLQAGTLRDDLAMVALQVRADAVTGPEHVGGGEQLTAAASGSAPAG
jgi:PAS domain S-box-containing protein